jgi:DNA polymerase III delta prime subunit
MNWLLYGPPGIGKTWMAHLIEDAFFVRTDGSKKLLPLRGEVARSYQDLLDIGKLLLQAKDVKVVVVDTINHAFDICRNHVVEKYGVDHMSEIGKGKGYDVAGKYLSDFLMPLIRAPFGCMMIGHEMVKEHEFDSVKFSKIWPNMMKTGRDVVLPVCDFIGRMYMAKEGEKAVRAITFRTQRTLEASDKSPAGVLSRYKYIRLEPKEEAWAKIVSCFQEEQK